MGRQSVTIHEVMSALNENWRRSRTWTHQAVKTAYLAMRARDMSFPPLAPSNELQVRHFRPLENQVLHELPLEEYNYHHM
jgi:hypothetical protein